MNTNEQKCCTKCGLTKSISHFCPKPNGKGFIAHCRACENEKARKWRQGNREKVKCTQAKYDAKRRERRAEYDQLRWPKYRERAAKLARIRWHKNKTVLMQRAAEQKKKHIEKHKARVAVQVAVRDGRIIKPRCCSECGKTAQVQGHHADYSKKLDVVWLCSTCHGAKHPRKERAA